jgi:Uma2 family endonuclease
MATDQRQLTPEEFLALPEEKPYRELIDGRIVPKVSPQEHHGLLAGDLMAAINRHARPGKLALAFVELRGIFGPDTLLPDVSVYRWDRLPRDASGRLTNEYQGPPDIAIEIVSPGQTIGEMIKKCRRYLDHGVPLALVLDAHTESIARLLPDGSITTLRGDDRIDLSPLLPDFALTVGELFATLRLD